MLRPRCLRIRIRIAIADPLCVQGRTKRTTWVYLIHRLLLEYFAAMDTESCFVTIGRNGSIVVSVHVCLPFSAFYLLAVCDVPEPTQQMVDGVLGVDLGIVNLATDSDGERYSGRRVERKRRWYANLRTRLQQRGSLSAKRHLRKLAGKQRQFQKNTNHRIAKQLVQKAGVPSGPHEAGDSVGRLDVYPHADDGTEIWTGTTQQLGLRPVAAVHQLQGAACWRAGFAGRSGLHQPTL